MKKILLHHQFHFYPSENDTENSGLKSTTIFLYPASMTYPSENDTENSGLKFEKSELERFFEKTLQKMTLRIVD